MLIKFPEFLPDQPAYDSPGTTVATNVVPAGNSYKPFPDLAAYSNAIASFARGAVSARDPEFGTSFNFVGDKNDLYGLGLTSTSTFDVVSKTPGAYTTDDAEKWSFTVFGPRVIATNFFDPIQSYEMGVSILFEDLDASAPNARYIATIRDFLVVGNTYDSIDGFKPNRVRWAGIGDPKAWTVSAVTMADYQDLDSNYGWITQVVGGDYGLIFQEKAITRMNFVGSPVVFDFVTVDRENGTQYPGSVVAYGTQTFYIGTDGFKVFNGSQSIAIGAEKVDDFFFADLNPQHGHRVSSAIDYTNHLVMWAYPGSGSSEEGTPNHILLYNFSPNARQKWAFIDLSTSADPSVATGIELIYTAITGGYSLDELDQWQVDHQNPPVTSLGAANIDILPYSLDSRIWDGNILQYGVFTGDHKLAFSSGLYLPAVIETGETQINEGQRSDIFRLKPYVDSNDIDPALTQVTVQIGTRNLFNESVNYGSPIPLDVNGEIQCMSNARYHRMRVSINGGFKHAIGVEVLESKPAGYR